MKNLQEFVYICRKKMIESSPQIESKVLAEALLLLEKPEVKSLVDKINDDYLYWSEVKYKKLAVKLSPIQLWACVKLSRRFHSIEVWKRYNISFSLTNAMQRMCHDFEIDFGGSLKSDFKIPSKSKEQYLISSLMEEAISSSQMEGASTTRKVAKEMLRKETSPKNRSEQMIYNNYVSIRFVVEHKDEPLTKELLLRLHSLMTNKTLENASDEGRFRDNDSVVVEQSITHEVVHTPPSYTEIPDFIEELCEFFNNAENGVFVHPIIRGIIVHFMIAYVHPFVDGNGRTARALFYWYMLRNGYWLTEYLSISRIIYKSKTSYEKAYLHAEKDGNDIGYFITFHLRALDLAFKDLKSYIERKTESLQMSDFIKLGDINERQVQILSLLQENPKMTLTVKELQNRFAVSHPTVKLDLDALVERGLLEKVPVNKVKNYYVRGENFDSLIKC